MILGAVLLIVALATSDAAPNREYDLADCRTQKMADRTHHAENPDDCRTFYNCDNAHGGKLTYCPAGTIYDSVTGICTGQGDCKVWYEKSNCLSNPLGTGKFPGHCCNSYYEYSCASRSFVSAKCPKNQYFMPSGLSMNDGSCGFTKPSTGCVICDAPTTCDSLGLEYVGPCEFKHKDDENIMKCAAGTKMDRFSCQCVLDTNNECPVIVPDIGFKPGCGNLNAETIQIDRIEAGCQPIYALSQRDLKFMSFAFKMSFTLSRSSIAGDIPIMKTNDMACQGLQLDVSVVNGNTVKVTVGENGQQTVLEGNFGSFGSPLGQTIVLRIVFDVLGKQFLGSVNSSPLRDISGNNAQTLNTWAARGLKTLCRPCLDNVSGRTKFSVWRQCSDLSQLN